MRSLARFALRGELRGATLAGARIAKEEEQAALESFVGRLAQEASLAPRAAAQLLAFGRASLRALPDA